MLAEFRKKRFQQSVKSLFIQPSSFSATHSSTFCLNRSAYNAFGEEERCKYYREILSWDTYNNSKLARFVPRSLKLVNQAFADGLNKYEAAARLISEFLHISTEEESDWLMKSILFEENETEYSKVYYCFRERPRHIFDQLNLLADQGHIRSSIRESMDQTFTSLFSKYPELRKESPPEPEPIEWWELSYNDAAKEKQRIVGQFESVSDVVEYIATKEGTKDLFWGYPFNCKYREWDPNMPPDKYFEKKSILAIPKRGWDVFWNKYDGIMACSNIDCWEAIKQHANVRPKDKDPILHKILKKHYQMGMDLQ